MVIFLPRSGPETGFVAICIVFQTKNCDVLPYMMHKVTFTSPRSFHMVCVSVCVCDTYVWAFSRVEIIWGIAPVRPGPYYGYLSPSGAGPKQALSLLYCLWNTELRRLASYYATSNFDVPWIPGSRSIYNAHYNLTNAHTHSLFYWMCVCLSTARLGILI